MSTERPDKWIVVKITNNNNSKVNDSIYKLFGTFYGGYLDGDRYKLNSGISRVELDGDYYKFYGHSGSCYMCRNHQGSYGTNVYTQGVLDNMIDKATSANYTIEIMPVETDWINLISV